MYERNWKTADSVVVVGFYWGCAKNRRTEKTSRFAETDRTVAKISVGFRIRFGF